MTRVSTHILVLMVETSVAKLNSPAGGVTMTVTEMEDGKRLYFVFGCYLGTPRHHFVRQRVSTILVLAEDFP